MTSRRRSPDTLFASGAPVARRAAAWRVVTHEAAAPGNSRVQPSSTPGPAPRAGRGVWRRVCAVLLVIASLVSFVEPLLAEAHDGDVADVVRVGVVHAPQRSAASAARAAALGTSAAAVIAAPDHPAPPAPALPHHAVHVCHCMHAHGGVLPPTPSVVAGVEHSVLAAPPSAVGSAVQAAAIAPPVRPPIA